MDRNNEQTSVRANSARGSVSVYRNLLWSRSSKSNNYSKSNGGRKRNRHYKYLLPVVAALVASPVNAETIGGVSATASPVANSSGSVTNQAIQVLQGPYITNTYGAGIQCQGATRNFTPYVTGSASASKPYEPYFDDPVYDVSDNYGAFDDDGNPIGDGRIDNPGDILFTKKTRTGQKDNYSLGVGFSITWSTPLDKTAQELCKDAARANIALMQQQNANKRLDFELARLKNCGQLKKEGIYFHKKSPYHKVCADVVVTNPGGIVPQHRHTIPSPAVDESRDSVSSAPLGAPLSTIPGSSYPVRRQSSSLPSSQSVSPLLTKGQQEVLQAVPRSLPQGQ